MKNKMKTTLRTLLIVMVSALIISCEEDLQKVEYYKPFIYLKSGDGGIADYPHYYNDSISTGYIVVGSGGSMPLLNDVKVELELDTARLNSYNYRNYGNDLNKYAKLLSEDRYTIPSYETVIRAGEVSATAVLPIHIDINGLSPDSTYMVPLTIKSVSDNVEINGTKNFVLYRVVLNNDYSSERFKNYKMKGIQITTEIVNSEPTEVKAGITTTKVLTPIARNRVRMFPGNVASSTSLSSINDRTVLLIVNDDNSVRVKAYKNIKVEMIDDENIYDPEEKTFTINYRYRLPDQTSWVTIMEILTKVE